MTVYQVREAGKIKLGPKQKLLTALLFAVILFALRFGWHVWEGSGYEQHWSVIEIAIWSAAVAILLAVFPTAPRVPAYKLLVDDNSITGVSQYGGWMKWFQTRRTVRKGSVRSIFNVPAIGDRPGGVGISERSQLGARMWGFVYVPKSMPEFEDLKRLAESWRSEGSK